MAGDFDLVAGDSLYVLVGQGSTPVDGHHYYHSPGGGGSFVALGQTLATTTPLVVAGGGGGGHPFETHLSPANATCGSTSEAGNGGYTGTLGGVQGSWGGAAGGMGSAAGFYSGAGESTASAFQDGGLGAAAGMGVSGGFGGGGAVEATTAFVMASTAGGGGGYSGGGASVMGASYSFPAGGGGSFNGGRNQENVACGAAAAGTVQIEALTVATPDARAPTAGAAATIGAVTGTSVTLSWGAATDDVSAPSDLQYAVVYATTDSLNGVAQALATGTPALQWSPTPSPTVTVSRLLGSTTYYFAVLVRDARGNTALYGPGALSATTSPVYVFTNAGASGHQGPTQAAVNAAYTGTSLASSVTVTGTGIQQWMVPATGVYRIEAYGAQGATNSPRHARGAQLRGTFDLVAGDSLFVLVGQAGTGTPDVYAQVGGGGGTFVAQGDSLASTVPLLVAGGGGGWGTRGYPYEGIDYADQDAGSISTSGNTGTGGIVGGADGARGGVFADSSNRADAAGGFFDGQGGVSSQAFQNGGLGAFFVGASGGFGGGGAAMTSVYGLSGGGGGYSGGGSSEATNGKNAPGGGGGSFNAGTDQRNEWGGNSGHGRVVIIQQ
jgi:hypothetical protein